MSFHFFFFTVRHGTSRSFAIFWHSMPYPIVERNTCVKRKRINAWIALDNCSDSNNEKRRRAYDSVAAAVAATLAAAAAAADGAVFYNSLIGNRAATGPGTRPELVVFAALLLLIWHRFHQVSKRKPLDRAHSSRVYSTDLKCAQSPSRVTAFYCPTVFVANSSYIFKVFWTGPAHLSGPRFKL